MTAAWGCCPAPRHPGELLTRSDVCHVHADRGPPELVRLDEVRPAVYRVAVVAVERRERPPTSSPPRSRQPCWRRARVERRAGRHGADAPSAPIAVDLLTICRRRSPATPEEISQ